MKPTLNTQDLFNRIKRVVPDLDSDENKALWSACAEINRQQVKDLASMKKEVQSEDIEAGDLKEVLKNALLKKVKAGQLTGADVNAVKDLFALDADIVDCFMVEHFSATWPGAPCRQCGYQGQIADDEIRIVVE